MHRVFLVVLIGCALLAALTLYRQLPLPSLGFTAGWFAEVVEDKTLVLFSGDIFLGRAVERWLLADTTRRVFNNLDTLFAMYPEVIVNFEAAVPTIHQPTPDFGLQFSVTEELLEQLAPHVTAASLANNHSFDFGAAGYQNTMYALQQAGVRPFGHPHSASATIHVTDTEPSVAIVGFNQLGTSLTQAAVATWYQEAQVHADYVVAYVHWGEEYTTDITPAQRTLATHLASAGFDVIIGHHPHVVQPVTFIDDTLVFYSLGNTVFDQYFSDEVQDGILTGLAIHDGDLGVHVYPISSRTSRHQPRLLVEEQRDDVLVDLANMSDESLQKAILTGFVPLPSSDNLFSMTATK